MLYLVIIYLELVFFYRNLSATLFEEKCLTRRWIGTWTRGMKIWFENIIFIGSFRWISTRNLVSPTGALGRTGSRRRPVKATARPVPGAAVPATLPWRDLGRFWLAQGVQRRVRATERRRVGLSFRQRRSNDHLGQQTALHLPLNILIQSSMLLPSTQSLFDCYLG